MRKKKTAMMLCLIITQAMSSPTLAAERPGPVEVRTDLMPVVASVSQLAGYSDTLALLNYPAKDAPAPSSDRGPYSAGHNYFVSTAGSDDGDGSAGQPWRSIQLAFSQLQAGDTLYILEGVYEGPAQFLSSGEDGRPIAVRGIGSVVIDGRKLDAGQPAIQTVGQSHLYLRNLTVLGSRIGVDITGGHHVFIDGLSSGNTPCAVVINASSSVTVKSHELSTGPSLYVVGGASHGLLFEGIEENPSGGKIPELRNLIFGPSTYDVRVRIKAIKKHAKL